jgi:hypothetical protein
LVLNPDHGVLVPPAKLLPTLPAEPLTLTLPEKLPEKETLLTMAAVPESLQA